ncbi:MAG: hypothetical protein Q4C50_07070 [Eubacteriales bacterium]|nr:hypothetical protein [Eubacteriales bacterium]
MKKVKQLACITVIMIIGVCQTTLEVRALDALQNIADIASDVPDVASDAAGQVYEEGLDRVWDGVSGLWSCFSENWNDDWSEPLITSIYNDAKSWLNLSGDDTLENLEDIFVNVTAKLGMGTEDSNQLWDSVMAFAEKNDINEEDLGKLAMQSQRL